MREGEKDKRKEERKKEKKEKREERKDQANPQIFYFIEEQNPTLLKGIQHILVLININIILFSDQ